jgi:hypothetical protein
MRKAFQLTAACAGQGSVTEGLARALHALLHSRELKEHGPEVVLVFDGAGTEWAEEWTNPESQHKLAPRRPQRSGKTALRQRRSTSGAALDPHAGADSRRRGGGEAGARIRTA